MEPEEYRHHRCYATFSKSERKAVECQHMEGSASLDRTEDVTEEEACLVRANADSAGGNAKG